MRHRPEEDEVCEASARWVADMHAGSLKDVQYPERAERNEKAVEMYFRVHDLRFVLEHTQVDSAPGRISLFHALQKRFRPLAQRLFGELPRGGQFRLQIAHDADISGKRKQRDKVDKALLAWIRDVAPHLPDRSTGRYDNPSERRPSDEQVPFDVTLVFMPVFAGVEPADGHLHILVEDDRTALETWELTIEKALNAKLQKLKEAKDANGATSIFVAETRELVHGPEQFAAEVGQALYRRSLMNYDTPDIALAVWRLPGHTLCWRVKVYGDWWHDNPDWGWESTEFQTST